MMNSPNLITVPLPPAKGRSIGKFALTKLSGMCLRKQGTALKLGKLRGP